LPLAGFALDRFAAGVRRLGFGRVPSAGVIAFVSLGFADHGLGLLRFGIGNRLGIAWQDLVEVEARLFGHRVTRLAG
jgi:hypothetical protein